MEERDADPFEFDGGRVDPGETDEFRVPVSETYMGDPVRIPVMNVQGFVAQERYFPIYERDLNRAFPGKEGSTSSNRIAHTIYRNFVEPCDFGLDFHTSTRGRTNTFHVRADVDDEAVERLAKAFGTSIIVAGEGSSGMLRREATKDGILTVTLEMGEAHRFERDLIDHALEGVRSVFAEYGIHPQETVRWPGWTTIIEGWDEKTWLRADAGGIVEMHYDRGDLVREGETPADGQQQSSPSGDHSHASPVVRSFSSTYVVRQA